MYVRRLSWFVGLSLVMSACNLSDNMERPQPTTTCTSGEMRDGQVCEDGKWVTKQPDMNMTQDMGKLVDLGVDMTVEDMPADQDMGVVDMTMDQGLSGCAACSLEQQCVMETCMDVTRIANPLKTAGANFGAVMAQSGEWLAVGAPSLDLETAGRVFVFRRVDDGWSVFAVLESPPLRRGKDGFGAALAFLEGRLVVGAPHVAVDGQLSSGVIFSFVLKFDDLGEPSAWEYEREFAPRGSAQLRFGTSLAVQNTSVLVGMPGAAEGTAQGVGAAYHFCPDGSCNLTVLTIQREGILRPLLGANAALGSSVSLVGGVAWAGAPTGRGIIVWRKVAAPSPELLRDLSSEEGSEFGYFVQSNKDDLFVGSPGHSTGGLIHIYAPLDLQKTPYTVEGKDLEPDARFGHSFDHDSNMLAVGVPGMKESQGQVQIFKRASGEAAFDAALNPPVQGKQRFGASVILNKGKQEIFVGAPLDSPSATTTNAGAIYIYRAAP